MFHQIEVGNELNEIIIYMYAALRCLRAFDFKFQLKNHLMMKMSCGAASCHVLFYDEQLRWRTVDVLNRPMMSRPVMKRHRIDISMDSIAIRRLTQRFSLAASNVPSNYMLAWNSVGHSAHTGHEMSAHKKTWSAHIFSFENFFSNILYMSF